MDAFGDNNFEDPAADFLSREKSALAGLENEVLSSNQEENTHSSGSFEMINEANETPAAEIPELNTETIETIGISSNDVPRKVNETPEKIKKWREEQETRLEEKDQNEEKAKTVLREQAKKELEDWYKRHEESISKTKTANRNAEKQFVSEEDDMETGTEWERIGKLCDFSQAKLNNNTRMKNIFIQLKQSPLSKKI
ncbi:unnamed protein product [Diamesa hyperborea]